MYDIKLNNKDVYLLIFEVIDGYIYKLGDWLVESELVEWFGVLCMFICEVL